MANDHRVRPQGAMMAQHLKPMPPKNVTGALATRGLFGSDGMVERAFFFEWILGHNCILQRSQMYRRSFLASTIPFSQAPAFEFAPHPSGIPSALSVYAEALRNHP